VQWNDEDVFVSKWVNYSDKYGIGYKLTNESYGVYFNDNSKIIMKEGHFEYMGKKERSKGERRERYSVKEYPAELKKKVTLLLHFKKVLDNEDENVYKHMHN
jgi:hypothetical protein